MIAGSPGLVILALAAAVSSGGCGATPNNGNPQLALAATEGIDPKAGAGLSPEVSPPPGAASAELRRAADKFAAMSKPGSATYKVGPQDVLEVSVFKVPELSKTVQVSEAGSVNLPLVGEIAAAGKTAQEIERDLTQKLGAKYLQSPQVTVFVKEFNSQRVTVDGAVRKPGVYAIRGETSLVQAIAMAQGTDTNTASSNVVVFRAVNGKRSAARFDLDEIRDGKAEDPIMKEGDVVVVDTSTGKMMLNVLLRAPFSAFVPLL